MAAEESEVVLGSNRQTTWSRGTCSQASAKVSSLHPQTRLAAQFDKMQACILSDAGRALNHIVWLSREDPQKQKMVESRGRDRGYVQRSLPLSKRLFN